ncbi:hypothetical protein EW146_g4425 [Bondarzewia mesenterica]|uniref:NAD(P)-binding domain-containing protein n=1 Tax=Bondarzewia mesenterica TaxID=1095465 RepID=A0A4S4LV42_9AGAM|nr:hypothetical protein EW146_g4425 [Bondarzewia mesenterica]
MSDWRKYGTAVYAGLQNQDVFNQLWPTDGSWHSSPGKASLVGVSPSGWSSPSSSSSTTPPLSSRMMDDYASLEEPNSVGTEADSRTLKRTYVEGVPSHYAHLPPILSLVTESTACWFVLPLASTSSRIRLLIETPQLQLPPALDTNGYGFSDSNESDVNGRRDVLLVVARLPDTLMLSAAGPSSQMPTQKRKRSCPSTTAQTEGMGSTGREISGVTYARPKPTMESARIEKCRKTFSRTDARTQHERTHSHAPKSQQQPKPKQRRAAVKSEIKGSGPCRKTDKRAVEREADEDMSRDGLSMDFKGLSMGRTRSFGCFGLFRQWRPSTAVDVAVDDDADQSESNKGAQRALQSQIYHEAPARVRFAGYIMSCGKANYIPADIFSDHGFDTSMLQWLGNATRDVRKRVLMVLVTQHIYDDIAPRRASGQSALLIGATGATGKHLLRELLASPHFTRVGEAGRRVTPPEQLPSGADGKLEQKVVDFEKIDQAGLRDGKWDVVFITLGTSLKNAGSKEMFEKIDREYVVNAAKAARTDDANQRLVYCSAGVADAHSYALYSRSKGLTEQALVSIDYGDTLIYRPGYLKNAVRPGFRPLEAIAAPVIGLLSYVSNNLEIDVSALAKSMRIGGQLGSANLPAVAAPSRESFEGKPFTAIGNKGALLLARENL